MPRSSFPKEIISPSKADLEKFKEMIAPFRDSGCRILLPVSNFEKVLWNVASGHNIIAPSEATQLGFEYSAELAAAGNKVSPRINKFPYAHCPEFSVNIDRNIYIIYLTRDSALSEHSLASDIMYGLDPKFLISTGAFLRAE